MPAIGPMEIAIILVIALIVVGPKQLPKLANSLGTSLKEFRSSLGSGDKPELDSSDRTVDVDQTTHEV